MYKHNFFLFLTSLCLVSSSFLFSLPKEEDDVRKSYDKVIAQLDEVHFKRLQEKADQGDVDDQMAFAELCQKQGKLKLAQEYYKRAIKQGNPEAQSALDALDKNSQFFNGFKQVMSKEMIFTASSFIAGIACVGVLGYIAHRYIYCNRGAQTKKDN